MSRHTKDECIGCDECQDKTLVPREDKIGNRIVLKPKEECDVYSNAEGDCERGTPKCVTWHEPATPHIKEDE